MPEASNTFEDFLTRFNALADPDLRLRCSAEDPPTFADFYALEERLRWEFPRTYRRFILYFGAAAMEPNDAVWPGLPPRRPGGAPPPFGWQLLGIGHGLPEPMNIELMAADFDQMRDPAVAPRLIPFFRLAGSPDYACFDRDGNVYAWRADAPGAADPEAVDFYGLVLRETRALHARKARAKRRKGP